MKGRLVDFSLNPFTRKQRITIELDSDFREGFEALREVDIAISIKKWRPIRSNDANKYFHLFVNQIALSRGLKDDEVKRTLVEDYGVIDRDDEGKIGFLLKVGIDPHRVSKYVRLFDTVEIEGTRFNRYFALKPTHEMDSKEMSRLIDGAVQAAQELGIDTDTPEQRARYADK